MSMTTAEFKRLKDLMMRAAATDSEPELVQCFKRATLLLATHGHTWAQALDKVVRVVDPVEIMKEDNHVRRDGKVVKLSFIPSTQDDDWDRLFDDAMAGAQGSFLDTLESIHEHWQLNGRLSDRQKEVVREAAERYAERHPGGRIR